MTRPHCSPVFYLPAVVNVHPDDGELFATLKRSAGMSRKDLQRVADALAHLRTAPAGGIAQVQGVRLPGWGDAPVIAAVMPDGCPALGYVMHEVAPHPFGAVDAVCKELARTLELPFGGMVVAIPAGVVAWGLQ